MRRLAIVSALAMAGCGDGGTTTSTMTTTSVQPPANIDGTFRGVLDRGSFELQATADTAVSSGRAVRPPDCLAEFLSDAFEDLFPLRLDMNIQQASGSAQISAVATFTVLGVELGSESFVGLAEANTATIDATESALLIGFVERVTLFPMREFTCSDGTDLRLESATSRFRGDVSGDTWAGDYTEIVQVTGDETGTLSFRAEFDVDRE